MDLFNKDGYAIKDMVVELDTKTNAIMQEGNKVRVKGIKSIKINLTPVDTTFSVGRYANVKLMEFKKDDIAIDIGGTGKVVIKDPKVDFKEHLTGKNDAYILNMIQIGVKIMSDRKAVSAVADAVSPDPVYPMKKTMEEHAAKLFDRRIAMSAMKSKEVEDFFKALDAISGKLPHKLNF